jgi:hypothetical protein
MHRISPLVALAAIALAACNNTDPAEVASDPGTFPVVANWTATAAPVAPATVTGALNLQQHLGFHMNATFTVTGPPNTAFQWRIFYGGNCTVNVAATNATSRNGIFIFSTTQAYPDITLDASGKATINTTIAGFLDSLTAYTVRVRPTATTGFNGVNPAACGNLNYAPAK